MKTRPDQIAEFAKVIGVTEEEAKAMVVYLESGSKELADYGVKWKEISAEPVVEVQTVVPEPAPEIVAAVETAIVAEPPAPVASVAVPEADVIEPEALEVVFTPETVTALAQQVMLVVDEKLNELRQALADLGKQLNDLTGNVGNYATEMKEVQVAVKDLKATDDAKIAAAVKNLPRATVKALQTPSERPSQRVPDVEDRQEESMLARAKATLYG